MLKSFVMMVAAAATLTVMAEAPQPVACWKLNEGTGTEIKDSGPNGINGAIVNAENTEWGAGRESGKALYFKGDPEKKHKGGAVRIPLQPVIDLAKPLTVSCWIKPASLEQLPRSANYELVSNTQSDYGPGFRLCLSWNEIVFQCGEGKPKTGFALRAKSSKFPVARDAWSHVAGTWDGKSAKLYVNGVLAAETPADAEAKVLPGQKYLSIGSYNLGYAYNFIGAVSDVKFFQQALTPAQVLAEAKNIPLEE